MWPFKTKSATEQETELLTTREGDPAYELDAPEIDPDFEPEPDPLDDLEPEVRAMVDQRLSQAAQDAVQRARAGLRRAGYDLTEDMNLAIVDPQAAAAFAPAPAREPQLQAPQPAVPAPDDDEEIPDPYTQAKEFRRWNQAQIDKSLKTVVQEAMAPVMQGLQAVTQRTLARDMDHVMTRVPDAVKRHAPMLEFVLDHPQFESAYRQVLAQVDPAAWDDPANLARMAGGLVTDLAALDARDGRAPLSPRAVGQRAPQNPRAPLNAALGRQAAAAAGPSRGTGAGRQQAEVNEVHTLLAQHLQARGGRHTAEELAQLSADASGDLSQEAREKRLFAPEPKRGRRR